MISAMNNERIMKKHIRENYGNEFEIIRKALGGHGSAGRNYDALYISQNDITYYVAAHQGKIIQDEYNNKMTGKILSDYLLSIVGEPSFDFDLDCEVRGDVYNYILSYVITDIDEIKRNNVDIRLRLYNISKESLRELVWLYEFYNVTVSTEIDNLSLLISVYEGKTFNSSYFSFKPRKYADFTEEEFFNQFEYREG